MSVNDLSRRLHASVRIRRLRDAGVSWRLCEIALRYPEVGPLFPTSDCDYVLKLHPSLWCDYESLTPPESEEFRLAAEDTIASAMWRLRVAVSVELRPLREWIERWFR